MASVQVRKCADMTSNNYPKKAVWWYDNNMLLSNLFIPWLERFFGAKNHFFSLFFTKTLQKVAQIDVSKNKIGTKILECVYSRVRKCADMTSNNYPKKKRSAGYVGTLSDSWERTASQMSQIVPVRK